MNKAVSILLQAVAFTIVVPVFGGWQTLGPARTIQRETNRVVFAGEGFQVTVQVLAPDLVHVELGRVEGEGSWAVAKTAWPPVPLEVSENPGVVSMRTPALEVRATLSPFRLSFLDRSGRLLLKDDDEMGMVTDGERVGSWKAMPADEAYYGLGEKTGPLNKTGRSWSMWNRDSYAYDAAFDPLYKTVPFLIGLKDGKAYGLFFDNTSRSSFDLGVAAKGRFSFSADSGKLSYYFFAGPDPKDVLRRYAELTGHMPMQPHWSLGYHQSRWSYYPESSVRFIADNFRQRRIPCDSIFLDIDHQNEFRVFTWDRNRFPDPQKLIADLRAQGFRTVTVTDPGVKADPAFPIFSEGVAKNYFVKTPSGEVGIGEVWAGRSAFPDFTSSKVREWWGGLQAEFLNSGVAGIWNDMNEPALFAPADKATLLDELLARVSLFGVRPGQPLTLPDDFVHGNDGVPKQHYQVHNVYGMLMARAAYEGLTRLRPDERPMILSRSTYAGGQRYAAVWTADNSSTWDHLALSITMLLGMGMSGLPFNGADIGGFIGSPSAELYTRWLEAGVFYPFARSHTEKNSGSQEPWSFGSSFEEINRKSIELRYRLMPYLYNAFYQSSQSGLPIMKALVLEYPDDPAAVAQNYEFLFGEDMLVAPVLKDQVRQWGVYLPKGKWLDFWTDRKFNGLNAYLVDAPLDRIPVFVREGAILPTQQVLQYSGEQPIRPLTLEIFPSAHSERHYYEDDGATMAYQRGAVWERDWRVELARGELRFDATAVGGSYRPPPRDLVLKFHSMSGSPKQVTAGATVLGERPAGEAGWSFDEASRVLSVTLPDTTASIQVKVQQ